jgi:hypothetical protein
MGSGRLRDGNETAIFGKRGARRGDQFLRKPSGPVPGTLLVDDYVKNVAALAYVWGWPMVNIRNRRLVFSKVPPNGLGDGVLPVAPLNSLTILQDYIKPEERAVATPNQDTVYGFGILSLDREPAVFQDFGGRYWVYQLGNQRTDAIVGLGSIYGTKPGFYMVVGPRWNGSVPNGITGVFRSDTDIAYIIPRAFMDDTAADRAAIQPLIRQIVAYPVSQFDGTIKAKEWSKLPTLANPAGGKSGSGGETKWVKPEAFFDELPAVLKDVPPLPGEEALYALFQSLLDAAAKDANIKALMVRTAMATENGVLKELHQYRYAGVPVQNDWTSPINGAHFGTDYYSRTAAARANIFVNPRNEATYFGQEYDSDKQRLNGKYRYMVTFPKDSTPPVDGFWSLTLYNRDHFFAPNTIKRYSIGTKNKDLKLNDDGSAKTRIDGRVVYVARDDAGLTQLSCAAELGMTMTCSVRSVISLNQFCAAMRTSFSLAIDSAVLAISETMSPAGLTSFVNPADSPAYEVI